MKKEVSDFDDEVLRSNARFGVGGVALYYRLRA
jgi:hypothetical protein